MRRCGGRLSRLQVLQFLEGLFLNFRQFVLHGLDDVLHLHHHVLHDQRHLVDVGLAWGRCIEGDDAVEFALGQFQSYSLTTALIMLPALLDGRHRLMLAAKQQLP